MSEDDMNIMPMESKDAEACAELCYEGLGHHLNRYLLPAIALTTDQWKEKHICYRAQVFQYWVKFGMERGIQCKVIRKGTEGELVGFIVWQDPLLVSSVDTTKIKRQDIKPAPPVMPTEIDAKVWQSLGNDYNRFYQDEFSNESVATIDMLAINSKYRNKGLAGRLVVASLDAIQGRAAFLVSQPEAVTLYKRHGFVVTAKGIQDGGLLVPLLPGETKRARKNWPMSRSSQA